MKRNIKRLAQHIIAATGRQSSLFKGRNELLILTYHRILPRHDPRYRTEQPGMIVEPDTFRMHLRELKTLFEPVSLSDWIAKAKDGKALPRKAVAITFDDGWRDNYDHGYPHLRAESFPATIFLVSDMVGTQQTFWPERLMKIIAYAARSGNTSIWTTPEFQWLTDSGIETGMIENPPSIETLDAIVCHAKRFSEETLYAHVDAMAKHVPNNTDEPPDILDWDQIVEMDNSGLIQFGSHTRHHTRMSNTLPQTTVQDEIIGSKKLLEDNIGKPVNLFCYPNGDITDSAAQLVSEHYNAALTTQPGWNAARNTPFHQLKRISIHQDIAYDRTAFLSRLSGWL